MRVTMNIGGHYHSTPSVERKKDYYYDLVEVWGAKNAISWEEFKAKSLKDCKRIVQTARAVWYRNRQSAYWEEQNENESNSK